MMVCVVSPRSAALKSEILRLLALQTAELVLLPGWALNMPSAKSVQQVLRNGVSVFVETAGGKFRGRPSLVTRRSISTMPRQVFARQPSADDMDALADVLADRTFTISGRRITFIICGEIIGFNVDGSGKHGRRLPHGEIIANPAHTNMGRWHILDRKFKKLSKAGTALHAANNVKTTPVSKTDIRIYHRGRQVGMRREIGNIAWCAENI